MQNTLNKNVLRERINGNLAKLNNQKYAAATDRRYRISNANFTALEILSYYNRPEVGEEPSNLEKTIVQNFLKSIKGNMEFNAALVYLQHLPITQIMEIGLDFNVIHDFEEYTRKTRNTNTFNTAFDKLDRNYKRAKNKDGLKDEDRVSLKEYSIISGACKLRGITNGILQKGFLKEDKELEDFFPDFILLKG